MKDRSIPILIICIVLVGLFIIAQETWRTMTPASEQKRVAVFDLIPATLNTLQFKGTNGVVNCVQENGTWRVGASKQAMGRADTARVLQLVAGLNAMKKGTTITSQQLDLRGLDVSEYGLDEPALTISAIDNRGHRSWLVGRPTPSGLEIYIRESGSEEIYTIPRILWDLIPSTPNDLRNRLLFPGGLAGVKRIEMRRSSGFLRMVQEASNSWSIQQPIVAVADPYEVSAYVERLQKIRIEDFIDENVSELAAYGLQGEDRQISLGVVDGTSQALIIGDPVPSRPGLVYARRAVDTSVFALREEVLELLDAPVNQFRDARVLTLPREDIAAIRVQHGTEHVGLGADTNGMWKVTSPAVWKADAYSVNQLIDLWERVVIIEYDLPETTAAAQWVFEFISPANQSTNRIEVLGSGERLDGLMIRLNRTPQVYQVNLPIVPNTIINPLGYKSPKVWDLEQDKITRLVLSRAGEPKQTVERQEEGMFVAVESSGNEHADEEAVERIVQRICNLVTPGYIAYNPRSLEIYGLTTPSLELYVGLEGGEELGRVVAGRSRIHGWFLFYDQGAGCGFLS